MGKDVAVKELNFFNAELSKLTDINFYIANYNKEWESKEKEVKSLQKYYEAEVDNFQQLGHVERAEEKLQHKLDKAEHLIMGNGHIKPSSFVITSSQRSSLRDFAKSRGNPFLIVNVVTICHCERK